MKFRRQFFILIIFVFLSTSVHADEYYRRYLTEQQIERVRVVKELLGDVDAKSLGATIKELEKTRHPETSLEMKEAMARAYTDIVKEIGVEGQKKKEWLYSMICLNMAYFQFGGTQGPSGSTTELNRLIRKKLIEYLPANFLKQSGVVYSL
jgi:ABC-type ATPase with predicted acetyltransferase domain